MTRRELEITDIQEIERVLSEEKFLHLGLSDHGQPYVLPMNYGYQLENGKLEIYLHGAVKGYKIDIIKENPRVSFSIVHDAQPFEGEMPCQYGTSYASVFGRGTAGIVEDPQEKIQIMKRIMKCQTGRDFEFTERLLSIVTMIRIDVTEYTAKKRPSPEELMRQETNCRK